MTIKGLTNQRRIPRLGKIHLGIKVEKKNDRGEVVGAYPRAVDYFVCPPEVTAVYGDKPRELDIMFPVDEPEKFAPQFYKLYSSFRGLVCKGDGVKCMRLVDKSTGDFAHRDTKETVMAEMSCEGRKCPHYAEKKCKELMTLQFLLPKVPGLGVWQLDTTSYHSIVAINSGVAFPDLDNTDPGIIRAICGRVAMIPLKLTIEPKQAQIEGKSKTIHCLQIRSVITLAEIQRLGAIPRSQVFLPLPDETRPELVEGTLEEGALMEEPNEPVEKPKPEVKPILPPRDVTTIKNLGDLFTACLKDFKMSRSDVLKELGVSSPQGISITPAECYQSVLSVKVGA